MKAHVAKVHEAGLKYILWYSVPFAGYHSKIYKRFENMLLYHRKNLSCAVLDPRFPEVREYLIGVYETAMREWDLDGFKLDFIDSFRATEETPPFDAAVMDCPTVDGSVERLLEEITAALRAVKDDCMIEFRQHYISPAITAHCNMLRVLDCAFESLTNRLCIADLRMLTNTLAVHSDMLFWAQNETPVNCARQLLNILFAVPQISVLLTNATEEQRQVIRNYLAYWQANRELLLHAPLAVTGMDGNYSTLSACDGSKRITALYLDPTAAFDGMPLDVFNGTVKNELYLENNADRTACAAVYDCFGALLCQQTLAPGLHRLAVPTGGRLELR
jgi:alpha-galactosidase